MGVAGPPSPEPPRPLLYLGSDATGPFEVDANIVATGRTCVIGASGSGKSYAVSVICEELCKTNVPFAIVDTEGEHSGLKEKYDVVVVGDEAGSDLQWSTVDLGQLASQAPDIAPLVLDLSETENPKEKVSTLLSAIYEEVERRRTPYLLIVEEADRFVPQNGDRLPIFGEVARRGRKRGMGLMVCTQRPSLVDKNILSQCGNQLIGKLVIKNDLQAVAQFFSGHELPKHLTTMEAGHFFAMGGLSPSPRSITIRKKDTHYGGTTPKLGTRVIKPFSALAVAALKGQGKPGQKASEPELEGINPAFRSEDVPTIVKRDKSFVFFGKEETVASAQLILRPLVEVGIAVKAGVLKKRLELKYLILDGETGKAVEIKDHLMTYEGLQRLVGLSSQEIEVLKIAKTDRQMSLLEIANKVGVSKEMVGKPLKVLEERRLVRSFKLGKSKVYQRVYGFPDLPWHEWEQPLEPFEARGKLEGYKLDEDGIREVIRGLMPHSDVQSFKRFVYPLYRVELIMRRKKRIVWLDGRTGKEFHP